MVYPADVVLIEGILVFYWPELREMFHMKLFVDTDPDTRLSRRGWIFRSRHSHFILFHYFKSQRFSITENYL